MCKIHHPRDLKELKQDLSWQADLEELADNCNDCNEE